MKGTDTGRMFSREVRIRPFSMEGGRGGGEEGWRGGGEEGRRGRGRRERGRGVTLVPETYSGSFATNSSREFLSI